MQLSLQSFSTLVSNMGASAQGACADLADLTVGSVTRALLEAAASVALWLQYLVLQVMSMTRLATSAGADVDSWVGDFGLSRLPGVAATGEVTLACFAYASQSATVAPGAIVRTADTTLTFAVVADPANPAWSAASNAFLRPAGTASITVPIQTTVAGSIGNVQAGTISVLGQAVAGIDTCVNASPLTGGVDAESDASLRTRFVPWINARARGTVLAIESAVTAVQQNLSVTVRENLDPSGAARPGFFTVVVDDGTGSPAASLLGAVSAAVDAVRPVGTGFAVIGPMVLSADVAITLVLASGIDGSSIRSAVASAIGAYINALGVGAPLAYARLAGLAFDQSAAISNVVGLTVNGETADLGGGVGTVVRLSAITVS